MIKRCSFLRRNPSLSADEFAEHWLGRHVELAQELPHLQRYVINVIRDSGDGYDGFAELWFESEELMEEALASPAGQTLRADASNFAESVESVAVEEHPIALEGQG
jgi:uncharacterized protein (TIGR02118 family)